MKNTSNFQTTCCKSRQGFTLLELLLAIGLLLMLVGLLWGLLQMYSAVYMSGTIKAERSQLVRSLAQLLNEDLGAAIQDPIHPLPASYSTDDSVRRFGLYGEPNKLRVDVVQINPFETAQTSQSSGLYRSAASGPVPQTAKVPELKTIFYDFVPLNATNARMTEYGLKRRELNFETPDTSAPPANLDVLGTESGLDPLIPPFETVRSVGSADITFGTDTLTGSGSEDSVFDPEMMQFGQNFNAQSPLSVNGASPNSIEKQLENEQDSDENVMWAPEVVECRFRYSDGAIWQNNWDSIEQNGLPVAIEVTLKLMPLADVEKLRRSPLISQLYNARPENAQQPGIGLPTVRSVGSDTVSFNSSPEIEPQGYSIESLADKLELAHPVERRIVTYLGTSPHVKSQPIVRQPTKLHSADNVSPALIPEPLPGLEQQTLTSPATKKTQEWIRR
ncbi:MAG: prepilin-type N-terminal cleavage/methylation domain-containing protein [Thermoguttaceae bacterium]